jgi:hypothetical protein
MIIRSFIIIVLLIAFLTATSFAQSRKKNKKKSSKEQTDQPTTRDPYYPEKTYEPKVTKKKIKGPTYESEDKYYERMAELEKTKRQNEKYEDNPRYTDPMYFGHKRPPKKHKPGKMKYCKECGLRH